ncbi:CR1L protein, partial [Menura novaehollandiae]|nr:CR1L protein [Menura novaehollandiae]
AAAARGSAHTGPAVTAFPPAGVCSSPPRFVFAEPAVAPMESYPVGAVVRYRCRPGYTRNGAESPDVTCLANSSWSAKSDFCIGKSCGQPEIKNGRFHTETDLLFGATVTFTCEAGYRLVGPPSAHCIFRNGEVFWDAVPSCEIILCSPPPPITNGQLLNGDGVFSFGMAASYSCNKGFSLIGEATIYCTMGRGNQGTWTGPAPECKVVRCENPEVKNGKKLSSFVTQYTYGDRVTFECSPGYSMKGSSVVTCEANSTWAPPLPTCDQILCGRPPQFPFATLTTAVGDSSAFGTKLTYQCNPGYMEASGKSPVITCQSDETWSAADPDFCVPAQCPVPRIRYGRIVPAGHYYYRTWDTVTFTCNRGYTLQGSRSSTCGADSRWTPPLPVCTRGECPEVTCPRPPSIANGLHSGRSSDKFSQGATVSYSCREGYQLLGNVSITCMEARVWSRPLPRCEG